MGDEEEEEETEERKIEGRRPMRSERGRREKEIMDS